MAVEYDFFVLRTNNTSYDYLYSSVRYKYHQLLFEKAEESGIRINDPARFGNGTYMTIGVVDLKDIVGEGLINIDDTISKLLIYEGLVTACSQQ